ncbi:hypothetical protein FOA52_009047 [Chlamydomonas sp. UWO 241]|nr:hypothetical protein FOA52_009047 [Chlamydomonas sp. UWO 241]
MPQPCIVCTRHVPRSASADAARALGNIALDAESAHTITAAGAIPLLVQLLGPGSPADAHSAASGALMSLALGCAEAVAAIAAAGAISPLVQLLRPGSPLDIQKTVAGALMALGFYHPENRAAIDAAAARENVVAKMREVGVRWDF